MPLNSKLLEQAKARLAREAALLPPQVLAQVSAEEEQRRLQARAGASGAEAEGVGEADLVEQDEEGGIPNNIGLGSASGRHFQFSSSEEEEAAEEEDHEEDEKDEGYEGGAEGPRAVVLKPHSVAQWRGGAAAAEPARLFRERRLHGSRP
eukprot:SAG11_NODE_9949_length_866_cov_3.632334_1_plen_149_part_01